jgi:hypothetical protein
MQCEKCNIDVSDGDEREHLGRSVCEDCYMELLSPAKACEPWAVFNATSFAKNQGQNSPLTEIQQNLLALLRKEGPVEPEKLSERLQITSVILERELATLRHMEKIRAALIDGRKVIRLWAS